MSLVGISIHKSRGLKSAEHIVVKLTVPNDENAERLE